MEETRPAPAEESIESRPPEKKDYHAPELTVYGDMRELTMTNLTVTNPLDTQTSEATAGV